VVNVLYGQTVTVVGFSETQSRTRVSGNGRVPHGHRDVRQSLELCFGVRVSGRCGGPIAIARSLPITPESIFKRLQLRRRELGAGFVRSALHSLIRELLLRPVQKPLHVVFVREELRRGKKASVLSGTKCYPCISRCIGRWPGQQSPAIGRNSHRRVRGKTAHL
jgi:hypothetical protein